VTRPTSKAGLVEVARAAKVSVSTVSRAISRPEMVSEELRKRIETICRDMNYMPNRVARSLKMHRTETVGLIVPTVSNPLYAPTIDGVREVLDEVGFGLFVSSCERDPAREYSEVRTMIEHNVDAILSMMPVHLPELYALLDRSRIPYVFMTPGGRDQPVPHVTYDNTGTARLTVRHLLDKGHREIAVLCGPSSSTPVIADRTEAALSELAAHGCTPGAEWVVECEYDPVSARAGARRILESPRRPTAVVCSGDQHAVACIVEAQVMGLSLPRDLSVVGCNDVAIAQLCEPQLTTVRPPYREIGVTACRLVLEAQKGKPPPDRTVLDSVFVERASVAAPSR